MKITFIFSCSGMFRHVPGFIDAPVEPRYSEGPRDWQNMFVITRVFFKTYIEVLFYIAPGLNFTITVIYIFS